MKKREGMKYITEFPASEPIVSTTMYKDRLIICTTRRVYELVNGKTVKPIEIEYDPEEFKL